MTSKKNIDTYKEKECYILRGHSTSPHAYSYGYDNKDKSIEHLYFKKSYSETHGWFIIKNQPSEILNIEKQFNELAGKWRKETAGYSTMIHIAGNDNYLDIIGMGEKVLPFILKDLQKEPDYWFIALKHITKANPVREDSLGDIDKMAEDWLNWARHNNLM